MAAVMRILGWRAEGLRCPDHEIVCCHENGDPYAVTLVQMPNGTGKTTTLELLRTALSGSATDENWHRGQIRQYQKKNSDCDDGLFEVHLRLNNQRVTIRMEFDFENEQVFYKTTRGSGQRDGFYPPSNFRRFMNKNFVNFYMFDGELAQHLLSREKTDAESVVENLFQINLFKALSRKVADYWEDKTQHVSATEGRGLTRRRNRLSKLRERRRQLIKERDKFLGNRAIVAEKLTSNNDTYKHEIMKEEAREKKLDEATNEVDRLEEKVREEALDVLETMRDPHAISSTFAQSIMDLKTSLDRVKLPESAAREFFEELADEPDCVCGRPIDDEIREVIRHRAGQYLGSDDVAFLNSMKSAIQDSVGTSMDDSVKALTDKISALETTVSKERVALNDFETLRLEAEQSDPALKRVRDEIDKLEKELSEIDDNLEKFESNDQEQGDNRTCGIEVIEKRIKSAEDKVAEITHTMNLKEKRDTLRCIVANAHQKAREEITKEICAEANRRIGDLMPHNNILIDRIDHCLILQGQEGGSVGETLSVAWGFLATLFHRSEHELPFVVDSPSGSIDLAVRPEIGKLIPNLTGQFIAFIISSEREQFVSPLKSASSEEVQFVTLFRKGPTELEDHARTMASFDETLDGMSISGETFFNGFQLDLEEAV